MGEQAISNFPQDPREALLAELRHLSTAVANELADLAHRRITAALTDDEIERLRSHPGVWNDFASRQILIERRKHSPYRSLDRAAVLTQAIEYQLKLAQYLDDPYEIRLAELVRRHGLSIHEIALVLDREVGDVVADVRRVWERLRHIAERES